jgi:FAD-dependent oxidoreductase domain-containing protein 1
MFASTLRKTAKIHSSVARLSSKSKDFDVVIVGGGAVGANVAFQLARLDSSMSICVVERDTRYLKASAVLSAAGMRQQFSLPANIKLSAYGAEFLKSASVELQVKGQDPPDMQFKEQGYLFLATQDNVETLK